MDEVPLSSIPQSIVDATLSEINNDIPKTLNKIKWITQTTTIQLNSADRTSGESRYNYTIDTSLFNTPMKHIEKIEVLNIVMPAYEMNTNDAHSINQYVLLEIPELNTHNIGSNTHLNNAQCMLFVDKVRNENRTVNQYSKNIMRQLPRQLTIRVLDMNGNIYGNELTTDYLHISKVSIDSESIIIECDKPFIRQAQIRIGDRVSFRNIHIENNNTVETELTSFLNRTEGHIITDFGEVRTMNGSTDEWSNTFKISSKKSGSIVPSWSTDNSTLSVETNSVEFNPSSIDWDNSNTSYTGDIMNLSIQNTLTLLIHSKKPN